MIEYHKLWIEQCDAAYAIKERFGNEKALGYLIGEKLMNFVRSADTRTEFAQELPEFVATINALFESEEIREYLDNVHRVGVFGHVCSDDEVAEFREAGAIDEDPVQDAKDVLLLDRIRKMLIAQPGENGV